MIEITRRQFFALVGAGAAATLVPLPDFRPEENQRGTPFRVCSLVHRGEVTDVQLVNDDAVFLESPQYSRLTEIVHAQLTVKATAMRGISVNDVIVIAGIS